MTSRNSFRDGPLVQAFDKENNIKKKQGKTFLPTTVYLHTRGVGQLFPNYSYYVNDKPRDNIVSYF